MRRTRHQVVVPGIPHHVILRGNNRRRLFSFPRDYGYFLWRLRRSLAAADCRVHAVALMANHVHLLTTPATVEELAAFVKSFSQAYAVHRNRDRGATGKLFEQRYVAEPIADEAHLARATVYIDSNPLRAGLVDDPLDQAWTTYGIHAGRPDRSRIPLSLWTPSTWYAGLGSAPSSRSSTYRERHDELIERYRQALGEAEPIQPALEIEAKAQAPYTRRLMRPNGTRARDGRPRYAGRRRG